MLVLIQLQEGKRVFDSLQLLKEVGGEMVEHLIKVIHVTVLHSERVTPMWVRVPPDFQHTSACGRVGSRYRIADPAKADVEVTRSYVQWLNHDMLNAMLVSIQPTKVKSRFESWQALKNSYYIC